jgi:hypothetical protein
MSIVRVLLITPSIAAYLGLAILGWGGTAAFYAHPRAYVAAGPRGLLVPRLFSLPQGELALTGAPPGSR